MSGGTLIVGASQAGVQLAVSLRQCGDQEPVTLVGAEPHLPYQRPPLSKTFLAGTADIASLAFRKPAFYDEQHIDLIRAERVEQLHLFAGAAGSGTAVTDRGRTITFDRLALTVGARLRRLQLPGAGLDGVCYLRDIDDAILLRAKLDTAENVVVIGGGFIGLEAAAVARSAGKTVTVVEAGERLISRSAAPVVSEFYRQAHVRRGTGVLLGVAVAALTGEHGRVSGVELSNGVRFSADLVLVGVGIIPRTELAEQIGLACEGGIVVDQFARTSVPTIVAAGDCTILPNPLTGEGRVRLESVQNAVDQARIAAATLAGGSEPYTAVPWFWSDQFHLKLQIAGLSGGYNNFVMRGNLDSEAFAVLYYRDETLLAVDAVNRAADYLSVRRALAQGLTIAAEQARDSDISLKDLILAGANRA